MEEGEVLLLATPGLVAPTRLLPSPPGSEVTPAGRALEVEEKEHFVELRAESAPGRHGSPCPTAHDLGRQRDGGRASSVSHPLLKVTGLDSAWMRAS